MARDPILLTKLYPPRPPRYTLPRPRLTARLGEAFDYPLTLVQASTGYGKSTALATLSEGATPLFWYSVSPRDLDPLLFVGYLTAAFRTALPDATAPVLALLEEGYADAALSAIDILLNHLSRAITGPALLILDDYHLAASREINGLFDHFVNFLPRELHVIVSTRLPIGWEHLPAWRAHGQVLEIRGEDLAFTPDEINSLFRDKYSRAIAPADLDELVRKTEGWPIALQLIGQQLRTRRSLEMGPLLERGPGSLDTLFEYLARDVLAQLPDEVQQFLLQTSVLTELNPAACGAIADLPDARTAINYLRERDLFLISLGGDHYRYHHLFHDFISEQAERRNAGDVRERHRRAARYYRDHQNPVESVHHLLRAGECAEAVLQLEQLGERFLQTGRLETLAAWIDLIPPALLANRPLLLFYLGELSRLRSRFDEALEWYGQAERVWRAASDRAGVSRALRGQALVFLDTLRPPEAERLLQEALRLNDGLDDAQAQARLLELLAENKLNMGKAVEAEHLRQEARSLREEGPSEDALSVRVKLRTGRLQEVREILEAWEREESAQNRPPRAHRETLLILSLVYSMVGCGDRAFQTARKAIALGAQFHSPFISAVGQMRIAHAHQVRGEFAQSVRGYEEAMALGDRIAVRRTRAEARWGLTRVHGLMGELDLARKDAAEGIEIALASGDIWVASLGQLALGASLVHGSLQAEAAEVLAQAAAGFRSCGDPFGGTAARLWLALAAWRQKEKELALTYLEDALVTSNARDYDFLFTGRTLLGLDQPVMVAPLLLEARRQGRRSAHVTRLLSLLGLERIDYHPGYPLRLETFGTLQVFRGEQRVEKSEWQRKKARQLLELFVTHRGHLLGREEIYDRLWPNESPEAAARDFRVTLNTMNKVLDPGRKPDSPPPFVLRGDAAYGLRLGPDVWIDAQQFEELIGQAESAVDGELALDLHRRALALYRDDYLRVDLPYEDWAIAERERLLSIYLRSADRLASGLRDRGELDEADSWAEAILARDPCWERAYRLLISTCAQRGDLAQARRIYDRCMQALRRDLDAEPSPITTEALMRALSHRPEGADISS